MNPAVPGVPSPGEIPLLPTGEDEQPVFANPWEAKAFALVVHLYQQGHFTWPEWAERLSAEIRAARASDDGRGYYLLWLSAAEKLLAERALVDRDALGALKAALEAAQGGPA